MPDLGPHISWTEMPEFSEINLSESYVLGWHISHDCIVFQVEAVLCEQHPMYREPESNAWACFHPGQLVFRGVQSLVGLPDQAECHYFSDASGEHDYGHIDTLSRAGNEFLLSGDFGNVSFTAKDLYLVLNPS